MTSTETPVSHRNEKTSSDRSFGFVFAAVFFLIAIFPLLHDGSVRLWAIGVSATFLIIALARASLLAPLNRLWGKFGLLLHHVFNPVIMALIFFVGVLPTGLIMRLRGHDLLRLKRDPAAQSYWVRREAGPRPGTMSRQF